MTDSLSINQTPQRESKREREKLDWNMYLKYVSNMYLKYSRLHRFGIKFFKTFISLSPARQVDGLFFLAVITSWKMTLILRIV